MKLIRDYIQNQIKKEDTGRSELDSAFEIDNLPVGKLEKKYLLEIGEFTPIDHGSGVYIMDEVGVTIKFLTSTKKAKTSDFDKEVENARAVRKQVANPANYKDIAIARVEPRVIAVVPYEGNKETIQTTIDFIFEVTQ